ncbi:hypothetical protein NCC49_001521 [Naganishia albida]|nr:hypothetical protein NCC49_001521 [Naganishia albida]
MLISRPKPKDDTPPYAEHLTRSSTQHNGRPSYAATAPSVNKRTLLPAKFKIGKHEVAPFVTVPEMKRHLRLLAAFDALQRQVRTTQESTGDVMDADTRWAVFCTRAEKNFEMWVEELFSSRNADAGPLTEPDALPGLEVVMIWHAYMLNPRRYYEDCLRVPKLERLGQLGEFPLDLFTRSIDPSTFEYNPPRPEKTPSARDSLPFPTNPEISTLTVVCPQCLTSNDVAWIKEPPKAHGYCQKDFQHTCRNEECRMLITHDVLRVFRVCNDLVGVHDQKVKFLPGLALMPSSGDLTHLVGPRLSAGLVTIFKLAYDEATGVPGGPWTASALGRDLFKWDFSKFETMIDACLKDGSLEKLTPWVSFKFAAVNIRFAKMFVAYTHAGMASVELGPAAMRQANFIGKMRDMDWLAPGRFEGDAGAVFLLQKAAARYHAFLDLMTTAPRGMLCPTLDIDLAWHTHQLHGDTYRLDTIAATAPVPRFVDHDDKVADVKLGNSYDFTAKAWLERFKVPYSQCGCHQGDLSVIDGKGGAAISGKLKFWSKEETKADRNRRIMAQTIEAMNEEEKAASHPSVHNVMKVDMPPLAEKKAQRLKQIAQMSIKAENLKLQTKENDIDLKRALGRKPDHLDPFVQESPTSSNKRSKNKGPDSGRATGNLGTLPYWGVSVGTGLVVGGPVAWGLTMEDAHCLNHGAQGKRGTCAVGMGVVVSTGVHGYCTAAVMGSCVGVVGAGLVPGGCMAGSCMGGGSDGAPVNVI